MALKQWIRKESLNKVLDKIEDKALEENMIESVFTIEMLRREIEKMNYRTFSDYYYDNPWDQWGGTTSNDNAPADK